MKLLALLMRVLAALLDLLPCKQRVALMSRQSSTESLDFELLAAELRARLGDDAVELCLCEPETKDKLAFAAGTLRQLMLARSSKVVVLDGYNPAVCIPPRRRGTSVVQLWHALGAVKRFGYQSIDTPAGRSSEQARVACMHENYSLVVASGPGAVPAYSEAFRYPAAAIEPLGLPRMDYLLDPSPRSPRRQRMEQLRQEHPALRSGKRVIVYAPTLRKGDGYSGWIARYLGELVQACPAERAVLVFAGHPLDREGAQELAREHECLHVLPGAATIDLLGLADCVITDYSAISLEAGLLRVPTCFFTPDIERYAASPGLNIDLAGGETGFCSTDAAELMTVALGDSPASVPSFERWQAFCDAYFEGTGHGATARLADRIQQLLFSEEH